MEELKPGEYVDLTRKYMTIFCARPEISFILSNGKIVRGYKGKSAETVDEELERYYFRFTRDKNGVLKKINDSNVKIEIADKIDGDWVVKDEFVKTFGFLNEGTGRNKAEKTDYSTQTIEAHFVNNLIKNM